MSAGLQVALLRARLVARSNMRRAIEILLAARVSFEAAARYVAALLSPQLPAVPA